jgi:biotin carboxyl carrier protein
VKLKITVAENTYMVDVEVAAPEPAAPPVGYAYQPSASRIPGAPPAATRPVVAPTKQAPADESKVCRSPIAGIVAKVAAQPGQEIQVGDTLLVLEAMKMETSITAPVNGRIKSINVSQGDSVQNGQVLVEFE